MRMRTGLFSSLIAALSAAALVAGGCAKEEKSAEAPKTEAAKADPAKVETAKAETPKAVLPTPDLIKAEGLKIVLAKADEFDGAADKIISKCSSCGLGMGGKAEHAVSAHGYTLHFCSDKCKTGFSKDLDASILTLKVPDKP